MTFFLQIFYQSLRKSYAIDRRIHLILLLVPMEIIYQTRGNHHYAHCHHYARWISLFVILIELLIIIKLSQALTKVPITSNLMVRCMLSKSW